MTREDKIKYLLSKKETRFTLLEKDLFLFSLYYFTNIFKDYKSSDFQKTWCEDLMTDKHILIEAFRESAKSTFSIIKLIHSIVYKKKRFIMFYCYDKPKATARLYDIIVHLQTNEKIKQDFGELFPRQKTENESIQKKSVPEFITSNWVKVKANSLWESPRWLMYSCKDWNFRPDFICQPKWNIILTINWEKEVSEIVKWDFVFTHLWNYKEVLENWNTDLLDIYKIKIHWYNEEYSFSKWHKIYSRNYNCSYRDRHIKKDIAIFNEVEKLKKWSFIWFPINYKEEQFVWNIYENIKEIDWRNNNGTIKSFKYIKKDKQIILNKKDYYILGHFWWDWTLSTNWIAITTWSHKKEIIEKIRNNCNFWWCETITTRGSVNRTTISSVFLKRICEQIKIKWKNSWKLMPYGFETNLKENQLEFIKWIIDSDWYIDKKNNCIRITSVNLQWLRQLQRILLRFNITSSIRNWIDWNNDYEIMWVKCKIQKKYDLYLRNWIEILDYWLISQTRYEYNHLPIHIEDWYLWSSIKEIKQEWKEMCYSFNVKDDKSYCNHLIWNHNCLDDIDVDKSVLNIDIIDKNYNWIKWELLWWISDDCQIIFLWNTIKSDWIVPRFVNDYKNNNNWIIRRKAIIEDWKITWEERYNFEDIQKKREMLGEISFNQNYLLIPFSWWDTIIKKSNIIYKEYTQRDKIIIWVDPAISESTKSDNFAIVVSAYIWEHRNIKECYALQWQEKNPLYAVKFLKWLYDKWKANYLVIETVAFQVVLSQLVKAEWIAVIEVKPHKDKISRLLEKQAMFETWKISFDPNWNWINELVNELLNFPNMKFDDRVDGLIYSLYEKKKSFITW